MKERNIRIDFLRVVAALAVVMVHVSISEVSNNPDAHRFGWWVANVLNALGRYCSPNFIMVSGALFLSSRSQRTPWQFYKHRGARLLPAVIFWTIFYLIFKYYVEGPFGTSYLYYSLVWGSPYDHMWYLYLTMGLSVMIPFFRYLVSASPPQSLRLLTIIIFVLAAIEIPLGAHSATFLTRYLPYTGYFLAGYLLFTQPVQIKSRWLVLSIVGSVALIAGGVGLLLPSMGPQSWRLMYSHHNPLVVILSLSVFALVTQHRETPPPKWMVQASRLAPVTLGIYLIHPLWMRFLAMFHISAHAIHPLIGIPATTVMTFALTTLTASLMAKVPGLGRTVQ